jgi:hypothetical protein
MTGPTYRSPHLCTATVSGLGGLGSPVGVLAKISILAAHAQHSALLGLEPLFTTNISGPLLFVENISLIVKIHTDWPLLTHLMWDPPWSKDGTAAD